MLNAMYPKLVIGRDCYLGPGCRVTCANDSRLEIHSCEIGRGCVIVADGGGHLSISGSGVGPHCVIVSAERIVVEPGCALAEMVVIRDQDHRGDAGLPWGHGDLVTRSVFIGPRVWIGAKATVLKGVQVGHDAVIGAGAVVTKSVPPKAIVAGVPATVVGERDAHEATR